MSCSSNIICTTSFSSLFYFSLVDCGIQGYQLVPMRNTLQSCLFLTELELVKRSCWIHKGPKLRLNVVWNNLFMLFSTVYHTTVWVKSVQSFFVLSFPHCQSWTLSGKILLVLLIIGTDSCAFISNICLSCTVLVPRTDVKLLLKGFPWPCRKPKPFSI